MRALLLYIVVLSTISCRTMRQRDGQNQRQLRTHQVAEALTEALLIGAERSVAHAASENGFYNDPAIRILFPKEVSQVRDALVHIGLTPLVDEFERSMNHAAEQAVKEAKPILVEAIERIRFKDAWQILTGGPTAATDYLRSHTEQQLLDGFRPIVGRAMNRNNVAEHWNTLISAYNSIPFTRKVNPDLETYVTQETVDGLFILIAQEEQKIRENPVERVTAILQHVFGS